MDNQIMNCFNTLTTFSRALKFAALKHRDQRRKSEDTPYINHPIEVADILVQAGVADYEVLSAAILHDTIEDTETTPEELGALFGERIRDMVLECSDDKTLSKVERKKVQIGKALKASPGAKLIKIADKLSNCEDIQRVLPTGWSQDRAQGYLLWGWAVCRNLKGTNEALDLRMNELFSRAGVLEMADEKDKLESYYQILANSKGEK